MKKKQPSSGNNNTYQKEQAKHLKRIRQFIKDAEKRGYHFYDSKKPINPEKMKVGIEEFTIPKTVKNPTAVTVKRLEKITKEYLYERSLWIDPETGDTMPANERRKYERSESAKKAAETRKRNQTQKRPPDRPQPPPRRQPFWEDIGRVRSYLEQVQGATTGWPKMDDIKQERGRYLVGFLDDCIQSAQMEGRLYEYSEHLKFKAHEISNLVDAILPDSKQDTVEANVGAILIILNEGSLSASQSADYQDAMDYGTGEEEYR